MKFYAINTSSDKVSVNYSLSLGLLDTELNPSVNKNGRPGRSVTGTPALILKFTGWVDKILTGSISDSGKYLEHLFCDCWWEV